MQYSKEFEEWWNSYNNDYRDIAKRCAFDAWKSARKDHYRIGEKVCVDNSATPARRVIDVHFHVDEPGTDAKSVRRVPEWEPKEGDAVLFNDHGTTKVGLYMDGWITSRNRKTNPECYEFIKLTPADTDKIGKPWEDI